MLQKKYVCLLNLTGKLLGIEAGGCVFDYDFGGIVVQTRKNIRKGFTLIELLVVVLILGILASVGLPSYMATVEKARAAEVASNMGSAFKQMDSFLIQSGDNHSAIIGAPDIIQGTKIDNYTVRTKYFEYYIYCWPESGEPAGYCDGYVTRIDGVAAETRFEFWKDPWHNWEEERAVNWHKKCYYETPAGMQVCKSFEPEWKVEGYSHGT